MGGGGGGGGSAEVQPKTQIRHSFFEAFPNVFPISWHLDKPIWTDSCVEHHLFVRNIFSTTSLLVNPEFQIETPCSDRTLISFK